MAAKTIAIRKIEQIDAYTLGIEWSDGHIGKWRLSHLRRNCPCAGCIHEWTQEPLLDPKTVSDDIQAETLNSVGSYALVIYFTDGHSTGIYSWETLRALCQCEECAG